MGAHLNAYTSREQTVYYAKVFSKDIPKGKKFQEATSFLKNIFIPDCAFVSMHVGMQEFYMYLLFFFLSGNFNNNIYVYLKKKRKSDFLFTRVFLIHALSSWSLGATCTCYSCYM